MENRRKDILRVKDLCIFEGRWKVPMGKEPLEERGKGVERERERGIWRGFQRIRNK